MSMAPVLDDGSDFAGEFTFDDRAGFDVDEGLKALVLDMDVRRGVVVMPHAHNDAEENGEDWHLRAARPPGPEVARL